jgi:predicted permease
MNEWLAVFNPISFLALLIIIGLVAEKTSFVPNINKNISKIITNITLPVLVIVSFSDQDIRQVPFFDMLIVLFSGVGAISILFVGNFFIGRLLRVPIERQLIHSFLGSFGNVIFLGYPFILYLFGEVGLLYAIVFSIVNELIVWTFGSYLLNRNSQMNAQRWSIKYLLNPNTISFLIGILMLLLGLRLPDILYAPLERLGSATVPLSMMFIGSTLAQSKLRESVKNISIWSICIAKMLLLPFIFVLVIRILMPSFQNLNIIMLSVVVLQIAMPSQTNLSVLAARYHSDPKYAAQTIFVTTLVSSITLPVLYFLCSYVFPF